jgi:type 1 glutamine amidotransferase
MASPSRTSSLAVGPSAPEPVVDPLKILLFAANPFGELNLLKEIDRIKRHLDAAHLPRIAFEAVHATRPGDLIDRLNEHRPQVVQFSGHGVRGHGQPTSASVTGATRGTDRELVPATADEESRIVLIGEDGQQKVVGVRGLVSLFRARSDFIKLVVLNACWTETQARAISEHIDCVIGTTREIHDEAARIFAARLYRTLAEGQSVETAIQEARTELELHNYEDQASIPRLWTKPGVDARRVYLVPRDAASPPPPEPTPPEPTPHAPAAPDPPEPEPADSQEDEEDVGADDEEDVGADDDEVFAVDEELYAALVAPLRSEPEEDSDRDSLIDPFAQSDFELELPDAPPKPEPPRTPKPAPGVKKSILEWFWPQPAKEKPPELTLPTGKSGDAHPSPPRKPVPKRHALEQEKPDEEGCASLAGCLTVAIAIISYLIYVYVPSGSEGPKPDQPSKEEAARKESAKGDGKGATSPPAGAPAPVSKQTEPGKGKALPLQVIRARLPVKLLIITGDHGHDWKATTQSLKNMLSQGGKVAVDVTTTPNKDLTDANLAKYDVLLLNYKDTPNGAPETRWSDANKEAFLKAVREGKGLVVFHFASSAFTKPNWEEFEKAIAGGWRSQGYHGPKHVFKVKKTDAKHPISEGLPAEFEHTIDDLYSNSKMQPGNVVLATAYSDPSQPRGTGKVEPVIWVGSYGKGRVYNNALGHDVEAMSDPNFHTWMLRGVLWAATGQAE